MASPKREVASTATVVTTLGRTSLTISDQSRSPRSRAASTYGFSRSTSVAARTLRATMGTNEPAITSTMTVTERPASATNSTVAMMAGKTTTASSTRMTISSTRPPEVPATRPTRVPVTTASAVASGATWSTGLAPASIREKVSRPNWSVPSG